MKIFVLNPGSSSLKFGCYSELSLPSTTAGLCGVVEPLGSGNAELRIEGRQPEFLPGDGVDIHRAIVEVVTRVTREFDIGAIGCRVVHGGARFWQPTPVSDAVLAEIRKLASLAPLHNPLAADAIETAQRALPGIPVVAVFDTAFHATLPEIATVYALPFELCENHDLRRYGFHGISHRYASERLLECIGRSQIGSRLITCHLGNGASICAIRDGKSIDTSMGLTPMEGLVMGTRPGDLDPGLVLHLATALRMPIQKIDDLLNHESGLLGVSGLSSDVRDLEIAEETGNRRARLALELFAYRVSKYIGAYAVALEGLDALAFTGGIGEHSAILRQRICERLRWMKFELDSERNVAAAPGEMIRISEQGAGIEAWVIPAHEELQIAREVDALLSHGRAAPKENH